jgi:hypothetical protein
MITPSVYYRNKYFVSFLQLIFFYINVKLLHDTFYLSLYLTFLIEVNIQRFHSTLPFDVLAQLYCFVVLEDFEIIPFEAVTGHIFFFFFWGGGIESRGQGRSPLLDEGTTDRLG